MDYRERGCYARGVYPTQEWQDTSRMETARVKQEGEADTRVIANWQEIWKKERGHEGEKSQKMPTNAKNLP